VSKEDRIKRGKEKSAEDKQTAFIDAYQKLCQTLGGRVAYDLFGKAYIMYASPETIVTHIQELRKSDERTV
jgi:hypothetical protein